MAKLLKLRRGTTSQHSSFTGAEGEVTVDTDKESLVVHDGSTAGGHPVAAEDMANVSSASIAGRLATDSIATSKIAGGALPTDVTVASANIVDLTIATGDIANDAVTVDKIQDFGQNRIAGRVASGNGSLQGLDASEVRTMINVENGATADQTAAEILTAIKTVDGSGSGLDADNLDGRTWSESASNSTLVSRNSSGNIYADFVNINPNNVSSGVTKIVCETSNDGWTRHADAGAVRTFINVENGATADQSASEILTAIKTVDGSGSGLDADLLDGMNTSTSDSTNTIVARNGSGYIFGNYINMNGTFSNSGSASGMSTFTGTNGSDNYGRSFTAAAARTLLNVENGATADQSASEIASALVGQTVGDGSNGIHNIYNDEYFRSNTSAKGLYSNAHGNHWYSDSAHYYNIAGGSSSNGIRFRDTHAGNIRGYVYANNSSQIGLLNASGNWSLQCDNSGNVTATGNVTAYSDARLKTDIHTINDALSICGKLRGVSYKWIKDGKASIGVIAQEVEEVLPEVVLTQQVFDPTGEKEVKSVDYGKIVGVLINAINELKAEVDELKGGK